MGFLLDALDQSRFDIQREVVKNERRQSYENRPYGNAYLMLQPEVFPLPHPYNWPTIGSQEDLDNASLEDVKDFFPDSDMNKNSSEDFIDNTKYYLTRLNAQANESKKNINKFNVDMFLGEISTDGDLINIVLRDHEYPDGDIIEVLVNDKIVLPAILLSETAVGFKLDLKTGFNVIDFVALNQGSSGPNTAEVRVYDDIGNLVGNNRWNLATGVKATYIVYKN